MIYQIHVFIIVFFTYSKEGVFEFQEIHKVDQSVFFMLQIYQLTTD
jgi:hypothetical protein